MRSFYAPWGPIDVPAPDIVRIAVGRATIALEPADGAPRHHFALRVPGDRFHAAQGWLAHRAALRPSQQDGALTFDFSGIGALASYVIDPVGDIVELIAFTDLDRTGATGPFVADELLGVAEIGLVVDDRAAAETTLAAAGLHAWQGATDPDTLQFVGARGHSLILASPGRGWLPDGETARPWPATVTVSVAGGARTVEVRDGVLGVC